MNALSSSGPHLPLRGSRGASVLRDAFMVFLGGLLLYVATLAPTVMWADAGHLQLKAVEGTLQASAGSHPLWVLVSHLFTRIPVGDIAGRVNFVSAVFGAATLGLMFLVLREIGLAREPSLLAVVALAVANTCWTYSVVAEVYTLTLAFMALDIWLGLRWFKTGRSSYLVGLGLAVGLGLGAHLLVVLYLPALLWLLWQGRGQLDARGALGSVAALILGASPLIGLLLRDARTYGMGRSDVIQWALFSFEGYDFSEAFFDFSLADLPSDLLSWVVFLGIQFVGVSGLCGIIGGLKSRRMVGRPEAVYLALLYAGAFAFAFAYRVGDRYAFYLPSYLPFVVWIGLGWQWVLGRLAQGSMPVVRRGWFQLVLALLVAGIPVASYRVGPELVARGLTFRDTRRVPGPRAKTFFFWPPKSGYVDARVYAEEALEAAPREALVLADPILSSPLRFLQVVEGRRPDVTVRYCCWDIDEALAEATGRPVALADVAPGVYPIDRLREEYRIRQAGPIYVLERE